ncbi:MAG: non-homologous end-joining DNA ligase [bacterium]
MVPTRSYGRRSVETSREDKILFPAAGLTKGALIDYHERIAEHLLPHVRERALVLRRFPDGIRAEGFYQKQVGDHFPDWIATVPVDVDTATGKQELTVARGKATLAYLANQATVSLHPWLSRRDRLRHPDLLVVDIDPPGRAFEPARRAALRVRDLFEELGVVSFPKLTGSRGVHVVAPLDRSDDFDAVRAFARAAMDFLASRHDAELTTEQRKGRRGGRVYLDVARNAYGQTAVAPWSVRARSGAPVAAPVAWEDLEHPGIGARDFTVKNVFRRIARRADPWAGIRRRARSLRAPRERLDRLRRRRAAAAPGAARTGLRATRASTPLGSRPSPPPSPRRETRGGR